MVNDCGTSFWLSLETERSLLMTAQKGVVERGVTGRRPGSFSCVMHSCTHRRSYHLNAQDFGGALTCFLSLSPLLLFFIIIGHIHSFPFCFFPLIFILYFLLSACFDQQRAGVFMAEGTSRASHKDVHSGQEGLFAVLPGETIKAHCYRSEVKNALYHKDRAQSV